MLPAELNPGKLLIICRHTIHYIHYIYIIYSLHYLLIFLILFVCFHISPLGKKKVLTLTALIEQSNSSYRKREAKVAANNNVLLSRHLEFHLFLIWGGN